MIRCYNTEILKYCTVNVQFFRFRLCGGPNWAWGLPIAVLRYKKMVPRPDLLTEMSSVGISRIWCFKWLFVIGAFTH